MTLTEQRVKLNEQIAEDARRQARRTGSVLAAKRADWHQGVAEFLRKQAIRQRKEASW